MPEKKYLIIDADVLPDIFLKVVEAKELLAKNIAKSSSNACEMVGLSRSTFYRYKDCVEIFNYGKTKTLTLYLSLNDKPGVLAAVLDILQKAQSNVLTINQSIPVNGVAPVCISLQDNSISREIFNAVELIRKNENVIDVKLVR